MTFTASLTSDLTSTDEIIHVDTNVGARTTYPWRLQIDDEILAVTAGVEEGLDWTVLRGADDTDPADHVSGTSVIASPLGTVTSEGHIFRDSVDPATNPDYAPPYIQPGDLWVDTAFGPPFSHKERNGTNDGWLLATLTFYDALGVVRSSIGSEGYGTAVCTVFGEDGVQRARVNINSDGQIQIEAYDAIGSVIAAIEMNPNNDGKIYLTALAGVVLQSGTGVELNADSGGATTLNGQPVGWQAPAVADAASDDPAELFATLNALLAALRASEELAT